MNNDWLPISTALRLNHQNVSRVSMQKKKKKKKTKKKQKRRKKKKKME